MRKRSSILAPTLSTYAPRTCSSEQHAKRSGLSSLRNLQEAAACAHPTGNQGRTSSIPCAANPAALPTLACRQPCKSTSHATANWPHLCIDVGGVLLQEGSHVAVPQQHALLDLQVCKGAMARSDTPIQHALLGLRVSIRALRQVQASAPLQHAVYELQPMGSRPVPPRQLCSRSPFPQNGPLAARAVNHTRNLPAG